MHRDESIVEVYMGNGNHHSMVKQGSDDKADKVPLGPDLALQFKELSAITVLLSAF